MDKRLLTTTSTTLTPITFTRDLDELRLDLAPGVLGGLERVEFAVHREPGTSG